jgi:hypothetical protein
MGPAEVDPAWDWGVRITPLPTEYRRLALDGQNEGKNFENEIDLSPCKLFHLAQILQPNGRDETHRVGTDVTSSTSIQAVTRKQRLRQVTN